MNADAPMTQEELYRKNLDYFASSLPMLHQAVLRQETVTSQLVQVGDDDWDIEFRGVRLYGNGARGSMSEQFGDGRNWTRVATSKPGKASVDLYAGASVTKLVDHIHATGMAVTEHWSDNTSYYLVVFGVGLGLHLRRLVEMCKCRTLILCEPNPEFLIHSMSVLDWQEFVEFCRDNDTTIYWVRADRDLLIATEIRSLVRIINVAEVDGMTLFTHYHNAAMASAQQLLMRESGVLLTGLGWLDDELLMIRNSVANLRDDRALIFRRAVDACDWPFFVVGSGPSIDHDLDYIAANADKAVIMACGTGLGPLLRRGIRPDFYVELENLPQSYVFLESVLEKYSLEGITLIGTTTIDPRIAPLFDRVVYFLRDGLASSPVFCIDKETDLPWVNPTVGNTGLAYGLGAGFREFYLFGIDMGAKDPKNHHAKDTPYMNGVLPFENPMKDKLPGNFGGVVYADTVFRWAHDSFEKVIDAKRMGHRFYNCSDGAMIKGAIPKMASSLKLPERAEPKAAAVERILARYRPYGRDTLARVWQPDAHFAENEAFRDELLGYCQGWRDDKWPDAYIEKVFRAMFPFGATRAPQHYFRGTLSLALLSICHYRNRVEPARRDEFREAMNEEVQALIRRIHDRVVEGLSDVGPAFAEDAAHA